ncbi:hypothetical protein KEM52_000178 [Ascosphaera acerosa]|nr:hypothetical protein KEM52_000178 [Ascosphaera acerosa]
MAYFSGYPTYYDSGYAPFFQLLDSFGDSDFDGYAAAPHCARPICPVRQPSRRAPATTAPRNPTTRQAAASTTAPASAKVVQSFTPRFDVRESQDAYLLDGELPGISQDDIDIEFTDPHTLRIKGTVKRCYSERSAGAEQTSGADDGADAASLSSTHSLHQATVEDAEDEDDLGLHKTTSKSSVSSTPAPGTMRADATPQKAPSAANARSDSPFKYWSSERAVGSFHRTFNFPVRVDQNGVRAQLRNGILSLVVPKEVERVTGRKIVVNVE